MNHPTISQGTKVTLSLVLIAIPLFVWAGRLDSRVDRLEQERVELRQELKEIRRVVEDIRRDMPKPR